MAHPVNSMHPFHMTSGSHTANQANQVNRANNQPIHTGTHRPINLPQYFQERAVVGNKVKSNRIQAVLREFWFIVIGAILFTALFIWKDFISEIEEIYFPKHKGLFWRGMYVLFVTVILILIAVGIKSRLGIRGTGTNIQFDDDVVQQTRLDTSASLANGTNEVMNINESAFGNSDFMENGFNFGSVLANT